MIIISVHTLWTLLAIWLTVVLCAFMFGWYARSYSRAMTDAGRRQAARCRHPSTRNHLPRPGRLPATVLLEEPPPPGRWWPALERHARADTAPLAAVEVSNWEAAKRRDMDAWLHERGMQ